TITVSEEVTTFLCSCPTIRIPVVMQTIEDVSLIIGGLALFMFAITMLRETLGKLSGKRVANILEKVSNNPIKGMGAGTAATFMTQSSSITVLTLIGFVNAGMMTFRQSVNVMLGAEIGTTVTAQLVAFDIGLAFWPLVAIGFFGGMFFKNEKVKLISRVIFSLGLIFLAMDFMKMGARELGESQFFIDAIASYGAIPLFGILIGAAIAGITQSSSATTSLVIALGGAGVIGLDSGITLIMGANIGTCFLELFAGIGATTPAKRTAVAQTIINVIGVGIFLPFLGPFAQLVTATTADIPRQIANAHTIFNVLVSLLFIPLVGLLVRFCERIIPDKEGEVIGRHFFDEQMLNIPQAAMLEAEREIIRTAEITLEKDVELANKVIYLEDEVDENCRTTERFIDKIREEELAEDDVLWRYKLLRIITDVERVGDLSQNIAEFTIEWMVNDISFSSSAKRDLQEMFDLVEKTYSLAIDALTTKHVDTAKQSIELEDEVDQLERRLKLAHTERMKDGVCMPEADTVYTETLRNLERISDHADNIALDVMTGR
ncbi:MAG: Na/Pi cotransporter family protein, partial [Candidatus Thorarchaeota archaeon]